MNAFIYDENLISQENHSWSNVYSIENPINSMTNMFAYQHLNQLEVRETMA